MLAQSLKVIEKVVALTGIEWVTLQFTSVQPSLSCSYCVLVGTPDPQRVLCESLWCDRVVTARALSNRTLDPGTAPFLLNSTPFQFRSAAAEREVL
jgi:hypothetical protein